MLAGMDDAPLYRNAQTAADPLERVIAYVEAHAFQPLALADLAAAAQLSPYHFARQFNARYGLAPMAFVRARRLGLAAKALVGPSPPPLVELAFDAGFESQEGFTRAFKRAFGVSPGRYRRELVAARTPTPVEIMMSETVTPPVRVTQDPAPVKKPGFRVAGVSAVFDETNKAGIPALWGRLEPRLPLAGQVSGGTFGVGCPTEEPGEGCFRYAASVAIAPEAPVPDGLEVFDLPAQTYLVFHLQTDGSELHPQMQAAMREIWGNRIPRSGYKLANGPDLEVYPPAFRPDLPARLEWWIPVET
jgi:AraC family transcriptional regulator